MAHRLSDVRRMLATTLRRIHTLSHAAAARAILDAQDAIQPLVHRACGVAELSPSAIAAGPYTHLRAHATVLDLVCRLLVEKKK